MRNMVIFFRLGIGILSLSLFIQCLDRNTSASSTNAESTNIDSLEENTDANQANSAETFKVATIVATDVRLRSSPDISDNLNIVGAAQRGDRIKVLDSTPGFMSIPEYGSNRWYQFRYRDQIAWVFGGLTSLAIDGKYGSNRSAAEVQITKPASTDYIPQRNSTIEASNLMVNLYVLSAIKPDEVSKFLYQLNESEVQTIIYACNKIASCLAPYAKSEAEMRNDMARANESLNARLGAMGVSPSQNNMAGDAPIAFTFLWVSDIYSTLSQNQRWENTLSYTHTSRKLASFQMVDYMTNMNSFYGGYNNNIFDQWFDDYTRQVSEQTLKYATENYVREVRSNYENYIVACLN